MPTKNSSKKSLRQTENLLHFNHEERQNLSTVERRTPKPQRPNLGKSPQAVGAVEKGARQFKS
jgi:hypothetical protein